LEQTLDTCLSRLAVSLAILDIFNVKE